MGTLANQLDLVGAICGILFMLVIFALFMGLREARLHMGTQAKLDEAKRRLRHSGGHYQDL